MTRLPTIHHLSPSPPDDRVALARRHPAQIRAVVLENTFLSVPVLAKRLFPALLGTWPISLLVEPMCTNVWPSEDNIALLPPSLPVLFLSGQMDEVVPADQMRTLHKLSPSRSKRLVEFAEGKHNDTPKAEPERYKREFRRFLEDADVIKGREERG